MTLQRDFLKNLKHQPMKKLRSEDNDIEDDTEQEEESASDEDERRRISRIR